MPGQCQERSGRQVPKDALDNGISLTDACHMDKKAKLLSGEAAKS